MTDNFIVRSMKRTEVKLMMDWAAAEGWNPGLHDADCFYQADPKGFWVGELNGEPIGGLSTVAYDEQFGFLGLYIVKPQFRGQGFGFQIWKTGMAYLGSQRNLGLDSVIAQQENYQKSGFQTAYKHIRYEGRGGGEKPANLIKLNTIPFEQLVTYDRQHFPAQRRLFLKHWIEQPEALALGVLLQEELVGYGVIRACHTGSKIGPLFANNLQIAEELFQGLKAEAPLDQPIYLDVPDANPEALNLAERHSLKPVFSTVRMYTLRIPPILIEQVFGATTLELG
jgi:ribosomal protein S18 acetylase RimI-like enzyme